MCIIYKTNGEPIPEKHLRRGFKRNKNGAGFAACHMGKIHMEKGFFDFESFYKAYKPYSLLKNVVHFRHSTCGDFNSVANCHPFYFGNGSDKNRYIMAHNGHLHKVETYNGYSDSFLFARDFLSNLISKYKFTGKMFKHRIDKFVGDNNKLVLMSDKGEFVIINEDAGIWKNQIWYSNGDYKFIANLKRTWRKSQIRKKIKNFFYKLIDNL